MIQIPVMNAIHAIGITIRIDGRFISESSYTHARFNSHSVGYQPLGCLSGTRDIQVSE
jgi:hypothetical protein